jgi:hypothetical protein
MVRRIAMNLLNQENQAYIEAQDKALDELKDSLQPKDARLRRLAVQTGKKQPPAYFDRYEEKTLIVLN